MTVVYALLVGTVEELISYCVKDNGGCEQRCQEGPGGPRCSCHQGYRLHRDGKKCEGNRMTLEQVELVVLPDFR